MRNVVVTGGSRGLGLGIARTLAGGGYRVVAIARSQSPQLAAAIDDTRCDARGGLEFRRFDLTALGDIPDLVKRIRKEIGPIYGLVNNAGIGSSGVLATMPDRQIERLVQLNTISPIVLTKHVVRAMMQDGPGRIVNIASIVGFTGFTGLSVYAATKASVVGFTRSLARELGALGINVNAVAPGFVDTEMTEDLRGAQREKVIRRSPLGRLAEVADIADAVDFLLGDKARNITGTVLTVDAGSTA
jgi:3-oxoacyl-[acyl-carrier protein] reductase